jgi:5'(3')-deoxyribonucleotidase
MRILVDLDGIVTDTLPAWLKRIHEVSGVLATPEQITKWNLNENPPLDKVEQMHLWGILNEPGFNIGLQQMNDASAVLNRLHKAGHDITIVTARFEPTCMIETVQWLKEHMPWLNAKKKCWFIYDKHRITGDVLIDDKAETLIEYRAHHPDAHLVTIDYPYNKHAPADTIRVRKDGYEWEQIEKVIAKLTKFCNKCKQSKPIPPNSDPEWVDLAKSQVCKDCK